MKVYKIRDTMTDRIKIGTTKGVIEGSFDDFDVFNVIAQGYLTHCSLF
jgi:hypothetical protein